MADYPVLERAAEVQQARDKWQWRGQARPEFAHATGHGEESVWDYPRPPIIAPDFRHVLVRVDDTVIAESDDAIRVLETAGPPTVYVAPESVRDEYLMPNGSHSTCEWKGITEEFDLRIGDLKIPSVAWCYRETFPEFEALAGWFSFYPALLDCRIDGEIAYPQPGSYYGGWVTREIIGPFKGEPGSESW